MFPKAEKRVLIITVHGCKIVKEKQTNKQQHTPVCLVFMSLHLGM